MAYVDPWGSVARTFQKDTNGSTNGSHVGGLAQGKGGLTHGEVGGSRTANSSASA